MWSMLTNVLFDKGKKQEKFEILLELNDTHRLVKVQRTGVLIERIEEQS